MLIHFHSMMTTRSLTGSISSDIILSWNYPYSAQMPSGSISFAVNSACTHFAFAFFFLMIRPPPRSTLFPYPTPFRSEVDLPLERVRYDDAMLQYGTDRPDRRPGMEIHDLGDAFSGSEFKVFADALAGGGVVRGLRAGGEFPRSRLDELTERAKELGAKGLVWATVETGGDWRSPVAKFLSPEERGRAAETLGAVEGDTIFAVADSTEVAARVLGTLRLELAGPREGHDLFWVVDFPMFGWNEEEQRLDPLHHPFTAPLGDLDGDPAEWRSRAYDVVLNGWELGGGSIRIHRSDVQERVFDALGLPPDEARERFGFLLDALRYGAPPHGGIAFGMDRVVALMAGLDNIRDVIPIPKTARVPDLRTGAPAPPP